MKSLFSDIKKIIGNLFKKNELISKRSPQIPNLFSIAFSLSSYECLKVVIKNHFMKKLIVLSFFFCCSFSLLLGQSKWEFGPSINIGFSGKRQLDESPYEYTGGRTVSLEKSKLRPSFGAGFYVKRFIGKRWGLNLGAQYIYNQLYNESQYTNYSTSLNSLIYFSTPETKLINQQLQAPLQAHFYFGKPGGIRPYLSLGGQFSYTLSTTENTENLYSSNGETSTDTWEQKLDFTNQWNALKRFDSSIIYGIGIEFDHFILELNRTKIIHQSNDYYRYNTYNYNCPYGCYGSGSFRKVPITAMSFKYKL
jgi:hypothetical protein